MKKQIEPEKKLKLKKETILNFNNLTNGQIRRIRGRGTTNDETTNDTTTTVDPSGEPWCTSIGTVCNGSVTC